ncbi:MAG: HAD-IA family hydrolase [Magnetospirillum sp. WYHS-4]
MTLQALVFDVDGTLAETEEAHRLSFNETFRESGLPWDWSVADYERLLGTTGGRQRILRHMAEVGFVPPGGQEAEAFARKLHERKTALYNERLRSGGVPFRPGVVRLIREAKAAGLKLAIATTTSPENVSTLLAASGGPEAGDWFDVIGAGNCVPALKPAPDIYLWVLERLGLPAAACLALEDSRNGLRAALAAGLPVVATVATYTRHDDLTGALAVVCDLGDPDAPCRPVAADMRGKSFVDLALLRFWRE